MNTNTHWTFIFHKETVMVKYFSSLLFLSVFLLILVFSNVHLVLCTVDIIVFSESSYSCTLLSCRRAAEGEDNSAATLTKLHHCKITVRSQRDHREITVRSLWDHCEITERSQRDHCKITVRSQRDHREITERSQRDHCEITERSQRDHCEITERSLWDHCEITVRSL